jgi:TonB family protein
MSYYSVDIFSSLPAGHPGGPAAPSVTEAEKPKPSPPVAPAVPKEALRVPSHIKKQPVTTKPKTDAASRARRLALAEKGWQSSGGAESSRLGMPGGHGARVVAEGGNSFPYPWYLQEIVEALDRQWHPPQDFPSEMGCQIVFIIGLSGQISGTAVEKGSSDNVFDQLALRAVLNSNPLPPLPAGYPESTLRVHMRFIGKRL